MAANFYDYLDELIGDDDALTDIRATVRRCWYYDFEGFPVRVWQGKGKLFTTDGNTWLGTIDGNDVDHHKTPKISDGRDGSSATLNMTLNLTDFPNQPAFKTYNELKEDQFRATGRKVICYLAVFDANMNEGLRPTTPIVFFKELVMMSVRFSEKIEQGAGDVLTKNYQATVVCKDGNFGRSNAPNGTYADAIQKERAKQLGVPIDKGAEYLGLLANRTYQLP